MKYLYTLLVCSVLSVALHAQATLNVGYVADDDPLMVINGQPQGVCTLIGTDLIQKYAGSDIVGMRFSMASIDVDALRFFISADPNPNTPSQDLASATLTDVEEGWNQVTFTTPYTIKGTETELYMGYYVEYSTSQSHPVMVSSAVRNYGLLAYTDDTYGLGWYDYSSTGTLAVQLVISGGNLPDYDPAVVNFSTDTHYYKSDETEMHIRFTIENHGLEAIPGVTLELSCDGTPVGQLVVDEAVTSSSVVNQQLSLKDLGLAAGQHTFSVRIVSLKDATISPDTDADDQATTSFHIYDNASTRTGQLMEVYVNQYNNAIPTLQNAVATHMTSQPKLIPVFIHTDVYGSDRHDVLAIPEATTLGQRFGLNDVPAMTYNRIVLGGYSDMLMTPNTGDNAAAYLEGLLNYVDASTPAFATVSFKSVSYNEETKELVITVNGTRGGDYLNIFGNGALTLYLTEDRVMADQTNTDGSVSSFSHDHVLRHIATATLGDPVEWSPVIRFTKEYTVKVDPSWNLGNMHAIAFLGKSITDETLLDNCDVTNAATFPIASILPDGIASLAAPAPIATPWYDLSGRQIVNGKSSNGQLPRGIYIRNGKKVMMKK